MRHMERRYARSDKFRYKRRRQRVGLTLFSSLMICALAGLIFFGVEPYQQAGDRELVQSTQTPLTDSGPEAVDIEKVAESQKAEEEKAAAEEAEAEERREAERAAEEAASRTEVPDIPYNATEQEAKEMLESEGLKLGDVVRESNDEYEEGGVFFQDPLPAVEVEKGSSVGVTLSSGPEEEQAQANPSEPATQDLYLTVPKMGLYDDYVANATDEATLRDGAGKITETGFPWQSSANTYIASHVYGYEGTGSWQHFAALPNMTYGDEVILSDANGTEYTYQVSNIVTVMPTDVWITEPVAGKDMVSLQTCVGPGWSERMVVQAERVDVSAA